MRYDCNIDESTKAVWAVVGDVGMIHSTLEAVGGGQLTTEAVLHSDTDKGQLIFGPQLYPWISAHLLGLVRITRLS